MNEVSYGTPQPDVVRDLSNTMAAQQVAPAQTEEMARNFLARVQRDIDEQVDLRVKQQLATWKDAKGITNQEKELILGTLGITLGVGVPLSGIAGYFGHGWGIVIVWVCLVLININVAWAQRR